jgi:hypothetical protein
MQEGYKHATEPPPITCDALAATIFEIGYRYARRRRMELLPRVTPHAAYLVLAPFLGPERTNEFIDAKLTETQLAPQTDQCVDQADKAAPSVGDQFEGRESPAVATAEA